jgi:hypothetical protein
VSEKLRNNKITITCTDNSAIVLATINKNLGWILPAGVLKLKEGKNHLRLTGYDLAGNPAKDCLFTIVYIPQIKTGQLSGRIYGFKLWPWQLIEPLANADILIKGKGITKQTKSDHNGYYNIKDLPEGKYTVNVYRLSYTPQIRIIYITPNKTTLANFYLRKLNWLGHTLVSRQK